MQLKIQLQAAKGPVPYTDISGFLTRWNSGDLTVEPELMAHLYPVLRAVAQRQLRSFGPVTLQATELANEAFIKLRERRGATYVENQAQFITFCARMLRNLIINHIRGRSTDKRGGNLKRVDIAELAEMRAEEPEEFNVDWLKLDEAMIALEKEDPKCVRLVELRYFLGYGMEKCAQQLSVSLSTATRMWRFSKAFPADFFAQNQA